MKKVNCILLIDDNPDDNFFHKLAINKSGVSDCIRVANDGVEALEYIINSSKEGMEMDYPKADLIFLDINMPRMNGFEFLEKYQSLDEKIKSKVIIIMLSTSLNPDDSKRALNTQEVNDFINKPLTKELILEIVEKYFD